MKRFVAATCHFDMLLQLVGQCVLTFTSTIYKCIIAIVLESECNRYTCKGIAAYDLYEKLKDFLVNQEQK